MRMALAAERRMVRRRVLIGGRNGPMMICMYVFCGRECEKENRAWIREGRVVRESWETYYGAQ